jgi:hypothetical protein
MANRFGTGIMVDLWNEIRTARPIPSLQKTLLSRATTLEREFTEFADWIFFTGPRADSVHYFSDAKIFPPLKYFGSVVANNTIQSIQGTAKSFSTHFIKTSHGADSTHFILTNVNVNDVVNGLNKDYLYQIQYSLNPSSGLTSIRPDLFAEFGPIPDSDMKFWKYRVQTSQGPFLSISSTCFPNPYEPAKGSLYFNVDMALVPAPQLYIYSASMDLVYSGAVSTTFYSGGEFATWDGKDNDRRIVGSGIYFYFLTDQTRTINGKFAILR